MDDIRVTKNGVFKKLENGIEITVTQTNDPAYWLLTDENTHHSTPNMGIFRNDCYICRDPEFAQMGLPLCKPCEACGGHVAADDTICSDCGEDAQELYYLAREAECVENGHTWRTIPEHTFNCTHKDENGEWVTGPMTNPAYTHCDNCGAPQDDRT